MDAAIQDQPKVALGLADPDTAEQAAAESQTSHSLGGAQSSHDDTSLPLIDTSFATMPSQGDGSPVIKQEPVGLQTPQTSSPQHDMDNTNRAVSSLKNEHGLRTQSPLRESSIPVPSTEMPATESTVPAKRSAPTKKKGTATTTKKAPAAKRRKLEQNRSATPSSRNLKPGNFKNGSNIGTPLNSSPARSARSSSGESEDEDDDEDMSGGEVDDDNLYCICKKPDNGTFMIGCDGSCADWFHGKCVDIQEKNKSLIDKFICPNCDKAGEGKTTFKRMCRRHGCRQPARIQKGKDGKDLSKYCSDECGVQFFRDVAAKSRGQEQIVKSRGLRRKVIATTLSEDGSEARGGVLSAGEVKALLATSNNAIDFQKLGQGMLSPPDTPDGKDGSPDLKYTDAEAESYQQIHSQKEEARRRHQVQKDRLKFINMVKQSAARVTAEKELKARDYCGYDPRLEWTSEQFATWRDSASGKRAFESESLAVDSSNNGSDAMEDVMMAQPADEAAEAEEEICDRKKCLRHLDWAKMMIDGLRAEMLENSDHMRALEQEEKSIRERAALRAKSGEDPSAAGTVEFHNEAAEDPPVNDVPAATLHIEASKTMPDVEVPVSQDGAAVVLEKTDTSAFADDLMSRQIAEQFATDAMDVDT